MTRYLKVCCVFIRRKSTFDKQCGICIKDLGVGDADGGRDFQDHSELLWLTNSLNEPGNEAKVVKQYNVPQDTIKTKYKILKVVRKDDDKSDLADKKERKPRKRKGSNENSYWEFLGDQLGNNLAVVKVKKKCINNSNGLNLKVNDNDTSSSPSKLIYSKDYFPLISTSKCDEDNWNATSDIFERKLCDKTDHPLPGVTRILQATLSEKAKLLLENWKKRMIENLGEEGFYQYTQAQLNDSKIMHSYIESTLKSEPSTVPDHLKLVCQSVHQILKDVDNVRLIESNVVHSALKYRGIVDCVAIYRGSLCLIDWKKSDKIKTFNRVYDAPIQLSAYIGALNSDEKYPFKIKNGMLVFFYPNGHQPSVFQLTTDKLEYYWKQWLKRVEKYYSL